MEAQRLTRLSLCPPASPLAPSAGCPTPGTENSPPARSPLSPGSLQAPLRQASDSSRREIVSATPPLLWSPSSPPPSLLPPRPRGTHSHFCLCPSPPRCCIFREELSENQAQRSQGSDSRWQSSVYKPHRHTLPSLLLAPEISEKSGSRLSTAYCPPPLRSA